MPWKRITYIIGFSLEILALLLLCFPIVLYVLDISSAQSLGNFIFFRSQSMLYLLQAIVENYFSPAVWYTLMAPFLSMPMWACMSIFSMIFSIVGMPFLLLSRKMSHS